MACRTHSMLLIIALLGASVAYGLGDGMAAGARTGRSLLSTNTTTETLAVTMPTACPLVTINSSLTESCGTACTLSGETDLTITQRNTLVVTFESSLAIIGGSSTRNLQTTAVTDLTLETEAVTSDFSFLTEEYTGFSYTPKLASYSSCGTTLTNCTFSFYAIDLSTETSTTAKACRFSMTVSIDALTLPNITSSQLYADFSGASLSASKAPLALLALLAVPTLFLLAL